MFMAEGPHLPEPEALVDGQAGDVVAAGRGRGSHSIRISPPSATTPSDPGQAAEERRPLPRRRRGA